MDCKESQELLKRYIEGDLGSLEMDRVEDHARSCERCRAEFEAARRMAATVEDAMAPRLSAATARANVTASLGAVPSAVPLPVRLSGAPRRRIVAAVAAGALVVIGFFLGRTSYMGVTTPKGEPLPLGVESLEGTVLVRRAEGTVWMHLEADTPLYLGDTIQTLPRGRVVVSLSPDSDIELGPGSTLVLKSFNGETELFLDYGSMTAALEGPHAPFYVTTPDGRIRALGTVFRVSVK